MATKIFSFLGRFSFFLGCFSFLVLGRGLEALPLGTYFSPIRDFPQGYEVWSLEVTQTKDRKEFLLARLQKSPNLHWEEKRIVGRWEATSPTEWVFSPELCGLYTIPRPEVRWTLLRSYDCDHLSFSLIHNPTSKPKFLWHSRPSDLESPGEWATYIPWEEGKTAVVHIPDPEVPIWGLGLRNWKQRPQKVKQPPGKVEILVRPKPID